ncbi:hypothetical protein WGC32_14320 [Zongyangia sp. HA2173]|uniref:hypothetical protein n=1 Tax=Zongyangia sp. HA2173 TaxID=3133035 RepID=UPI003165D40F
MKIYKNPFVSRRSYLIPIAPARTSKGECKATRGYIIEEIDGKWEFRNGEYYNISLKERMPVVGEVSKSILKNAIIQIVIDNVKEN